MLHKHVPLFKNVVFVLTIRIDKLERLVMNKIRQLHGSYYWSSNHHYLRARIQRGGAGGPDHPPLENYKTIVFLSNIGPDHLKNNKATKPAFNVGPSSFKWRFAGGPLMARFLMT